MSSYEPDILAHGLDVIFRGVNPATTAAAAGHNFSSYSNRFWTVLHLAGFTDVRLQPDQEQRLLEYRCGLTAVVDRPTRRAIDVPLDEFRKALPGFEAKIRRYAPRSVAFLGKRAFSAMMEQPDVAWGIYPAKFAGATAWLLPNPSGFNKAFSLETLVGAYGDLRAALLVGSSPWDFRSQTTRASCFCVESGRDSRIGKILIQPVGWAEASRDAEAIFARLARAGDRRGGERRDEPPGRRAAL